MHKAGSESDDLRAGHAMPQYGLSTACTRVRAGIRRACIRGLRGPGGSSGCVGARATQSGARRPGKTRACLLHARAPVPRRRTRRGPATCSRGFASSAGRAPCHTTRRSRDRHVTVKTRRARGAAASFHCLTSKEAILMSCLPSWRSGSTLASENEPSPLFGKSACAEKRRGGRTCHLVGIYFFSVDAKRYVQCVMVVSGAVRAWCAHLGAVPVII